ncbi:HAD family phosphatase [bacterium]|nr:HAD family phosphatase [bacterium]
MQGFIFDFNGTLFWDSAYHEQAWQEMALQVRSKELSPEEIRTHLHGRTNSAVIEYLCGHKVDADEIASIAAQKEKIYRHICLSLNGGFRLAAGVPEILTLLKEKQVPMTIATSSELENLHFYFRHFELNRWFDLDKVIYDNGTFPGKPAPDIFLCAAKMLGLLPSECTVFEDSFSGIRSAIDAGIGRIIYVNSGNMALEPELAGQVSTTIQNFSELSIQ